MDLFNFISIFNNNRLMSKTIFLMEKPEVLYMQKDSNNRKMKEEKQKVLGNLLQNTDYLLSIYTQQGRNNSRHLFFSRTDVTIINAYSPVDIILNLSEVHKKEFINVGNGCEDYSFPFISLANKKLNGDNYINKVPLKIPIKSELIDLNQISSAKNVNFCNGPKNPNMLIGFNAFDKENLFEFNKVNIPKLLSCNLSGKIQGNDLFSKDIFFLIDIKKVIKSIQFSIESYKNLFIETLKNGRLQKQKTEFFVPLLEYPNIGILIVSRPDFSPQEIINMKTNFNSIVKRNFKLSKLFISFNVSFLFNSNFQDNKIPLYKPIDENIKTNIPYCSNLSISNNKNYNAANISLLENNTSFLYRNVGDFKNAKVLTEYNKRNYYNKINIKTNKSYYPRNEEYDNKYSKFSKSDLLDTIIVNSNDIFAKTLFNRYQDKTNSICNFKILIEFLKLKFNKSIDEINLFYFFKSFSEVSCLSLTIPFFKMDGSMVKISLTPSLSSLVLYIKDTKFVKRIMKKYPNFKDINESNVHSKESKHQAMILSKSFSEDCSISIDDFKISNYEKNTIKISYNDQRPYYLTESLYSTISEFMKKFKYIKKISVNKILMEKSYICISWNSINNNNSNNIPSSHFYSYYQFNGTLLGVIPNKIDENFWTKSIEEISNKRIKVDYRNLIKTNSDKVNSFIIKNNNDGNFL